MIFVKILLAVFSIGFANELKQKLSEDTMRRYNLDPKNFELELDTACLDDETSFGAKVIKPFRVFNTTMKPGSRVAFCNNKLRDYTFSNKEVIKIDGFSCTGTTSFKQGKLCQCVLAADTKSKGIDILAPSMIFVENGEIKYFIADRAWKSGKYNIEKDVYSWDKNGELRKDPIPDMINTCEEDD